MQEIENLGGREHSRRIARFTPAASRRDARSRKTSTGDLRQVGAFEGRGTIVATLTMALSTRSSSGQIQKRAARNCARPASSEVAEVRRLADRRCSPPWPRAEVRATHRAHIDVPAFALGCIWGRRVTEAREAGLHVGAGRR